MEMHHIYFVDDSSAEQKLFELLVRIKKLPLRVEAFFDPIAALQALKKNPKEEWPSAIISDIKMPLMDGFEFADVFLEQYHSYQPRILFFLCSSSIRLEDSERAETHPAVAHFLEKPLNEIKIKGQILPRLQNKH